MQRPPSLPAWPARAHGRRARLWGPMMPRWRCWRCGHRRRLRDGQWYAEFRGVAHVCVLLLLLLQDGQWYTDFRGMAHVDGGAPASGAAAGG